MDWTQQHDEEFEAMMSEPFPAHGAVVSAARNTQQLLASKRQEAEAWQDSAMYWSGECAKTRRMFISAAVACSLGWGLVLILASVVWGD